MFFDKFCARCYIVSLGPMKSRTKVFKTKANFPVTKDFGLYFPVFSRVPKLRGLSKGTPGILTTTVEFIRSFL